MFFFQGYQRHDIVVKNTMPQRINPVRITRESVNVEAISFLQRKCRATISVARSSQDQPERGMPSQNI